MTENSDELNKLLEKLNLLLKRQDEFAKEIDSLKIEITSLINSPNNEEKEKISRKEVSESELEKPIQSKVDSAKTMRTESSEKVQEPIKQATFTGPKKQRGKSNLEKFIGENLINKIGILITIIGVGIGAKYTIEHDLISPLTRIILGYIAGISLLGFGIKLKKKYESYSAVLVSGSIAILYFITFFGYSLYGLFPQLFAFGLMLIFTAFAVVASINYNKQIIAHIGLVGAYAVPFLLSNDSGNASVLFSYMAIINVGILVISLRKYWKALFHSSFWMTWLIYIYWFSFEFTFETHFGLAFTFLSVFFGIFYICFLAYKLVQKEKFNFGDVILIISNSFIFYGIGFLLLNQHPKGNELLGLFTLGNAFIHFIVSLILFKKKLADKNLFYLISGLVLVFITISIPVQLEGNWITIFWFVEAALLFWIGRTKGVSFYEKLSYFLMLLAFFSLIQDWESISFGEYSNNPTLKITPFLNIYFLTNILAIASFASIYFINKNKKFTHAFFKYKNLTQFLSLLISATFIYLIYYTFRLEIDMYYEQLFSFSQDYMRENPDADSSYYANYDFIRFKTIWIINYSLFFVSLLAFLNSLKLKNRKFGMINIVLIIFTMLIFLVFGLYALSDLRDSYLDQTNIYYSDIGKFNIAIRYISFAFVAFTLFACYKLLKQDFMKGIFNVGFDLLLTISILWISSSELINWMDLAHYSETYKLGLSILWGISSLILIIIGIWKKKKYLRWLAMGLFGITLVKLFVYDISHLDTISRTIVLVSLGVLLLIISFLYNKYKHIISDEQTS